MINLQFVQILKNQRRGGGRIRNDVYPVWYHNNSLANNTPHTTPPEEGGYEHYPTKVEGHVIRARSDSFKDYFSQPRIFWNSLTPVEKQHLVESLSYQIGSCESKSVRQQAVNMLVNVDQEMAHVIADNVGVKRPSGTNVPISTSYPSLSMMNSPYYAYTQKVGVLIGNGFNSKEVMNVLNLLKEHGVFVVIISESLGTVTGSDGTKLKVDKTFLTSSPYLLDSLYIVGGKSKNEAKFNQDIMYYTNIAYQHYKPIGVATSSQSYIQPSEENNLAGVIFTANNPNFGNEFVDAIATQRFWNRT